MGNTVKIIVRTAGFDKQASLSDTAKNIYEWVSQLAKLNWRTKLSKIASLPPVAELISALDALSNAWKNPTNFPHLLDQANHAAHHVIQALLKAELDTPEEYMDLVRGIERLVFLANQIPHIFGSTKTNVIVKFAPKSHQHTT
jgi:hypothetical protein